MQPNILCIPLTKLVHGGLGGVAGRVIVAQVEVLAETVVVKVAVEQETAIL